MEAIDEQQEPDDLTEAVVHQHHHHLDPTAVLAAVPEEHDNDDDDDERAVIWGDLRPSQRDDSEYQQIVEEQYLVSASVAAEASSSEVLRSEPPVESSMASKVDEDSNESRENKQQEIVVAAKPENKQQLTLFKEPKLNFFTDQTAVPVQLNNLQQQTMRRRHEFQTRIHDIQCKIAALTAKLADNTMDREKQMCTALQDTVYQPLQDAFESISLKHDSPSGGAASSICSTPPSQHWMALEQRLSSLDSQLTHAAHVRLADAHRHVQKSVGGDLQELEHEMEQERAAADKRELTHQSRALESLAGTMARRFQEERVTRIAVVQAERDATNPNAIMAASQPLGNVLDEIRQLRAKLAAETEERKASDERIREYIVTSTQAMKEAILEAYPDM